MRGFLLVLLVGCTISSGGSRNPDDDPVLPDLLHDGCRSDSTCRPGNVCTRSGDCLPPSQVRAVHVRWVVSGKVADDSTCSRYPNLRIKIHPEDDSDLVTYAPVPCVVGLFTVDKLPTTFDRADLGPERTKDGWGSGNIDATGEATLDLPF